MADASTLAMFARLVFSLAVVIGLMWASAHVLRRRGLAPAARNASKNVQVEMLARKSLGRNSSIAVVRVGGRSMVVGITDHYVNKLDDADVDEIDLDEAGATWTVPQGSSGPAPTWKAMLEQMRNRTTRH
jgi:flagellar biogenesis protein FliO